MTGVVRVADFVFIFKIFLGKCSSASIQDKVELAEVVPPTLFEGFTLLHYLVLALFKVHFNAFWFVKHMLDLQKFI